MSCAPYLVHDAEHNQRQPGPNKYNCLLTIVSNDGHIVLDIWTRSKNSFRLRQRKTPANRKMITATVNATRSAGTPVCSITAITRGPFAFMEKRYRCARFFSTTRPEDFPLLPKDGLLIPLRREVCRERNRSH